MTQTSQIPGMRLEPNKTNCSASITPPNSTCFIIANKTNTQSSVALYPSAKLKAFYYIRDGDRFEKKNTNKDTTQATLEAAPDQEMITDLFSSDGQLQAWVCCFCCCW